MTGRPRSLRRAGGDRGPFVLPGAARSALDRAAALAAAAPGTARHVVVLCRGELFHLQVADEDGRALSRAAVVAALTRVAAEAVAPRWPVAYLTADWARARPLLVAAGPANPDALDEVTGARCCLSLAATGTATAAAVRGGEPGNRWLAAALSLVVFPDGTAGGVGEAGVADLLGKAERQPWGRAAAGEAAVRPVRFQLDDVLRAEIGRAAAG